MEAFIFIFWIILSFVVAGMGSSKSVGYGGTLIISLLFSPVIGLLVVIASGEKKMVKKVNPRVQKLTDNAIKLKNKDIDEAIRLMQGALYGDPMFGRTHFNLACLYSIKNDKSNCFKHLEKAAELNYPDIKKMTTDRDLEWIRTQSEFQDFVVNGYKAKKSEIKKESNNQDYISELKELAKLKDDGILTEQEFQSKKSEILHDKAR